MGMAVPESVLVRRKKALLDKLVDGNPGKRKLTIMEFSDTADLRVEKMPQPRDFLAANQKNGREFLAVDIYERTWEWLHERGCSHLIPVQILEQYAMAISHWIQCEEAISEYGFCDEIVQAVCLVCFLIKNKACFFQDKAIIMRV